jgi:hypothetical protein
MRSLARDAECVATRRAVSYDVSYPEFLRYFEHATPLNRHHVIIAANFAYGWMPTILKSLSENLENAVAVLNRARDGELLQHQDIKVLSDAINGSTVGASKVLHFAAPRVFAIWDSRVASYLGTSPERGDRGTAQYLAYNDTCRAVASMPGSEVIATKVREVVG